MKSDKKKCYRRLLHRKHGLQTEYNYYTDVVLISFVTLSLCSAFKCLPTTVSVFKISIYCRVLLKTVLATDQFHKEKNTRTHEPNNEIVSLFTLLIGGND